MENVVVLIGIVFLACLFLAFEFWWGNKTSDAQLDQLKKVYYLKSSLFDKYERAFYECLKKTLPEEFTIFTKVRIEDFISVQKNVENSQQFRGYIKSRHLDFLVCDKEMKPVLAIEVDGSSHQLSNTTKADQRKNQICEAVGLPLERVRIGTDYNVECLKLRNDLLGYLSSTFQEIHKF